MKAKKPLKTPIKKPGGRKKSPAASSASKKTAPMRAVKKVAAKTATAKPAKRAPAKAKKPTTAKTNLKKTTTPKPAATAKKTAAKPAAKKTAVKPAAKKTAAKPAVKKTAAKAPEKKPAAKRPAAKPAAKKPAAKASAKPVPKTDARKASAKQPARAKSKKTDTEHFSKEELQGFYLSMLDMAKRLSLQVSELREQSLLRHDEVNQDEDGTDAFERVTSLDRASADQSQIFQINKAIEAINDGSYGICDICGHKIEKRRLKALPFAKTCIQCQSEMEDNGNRRKPTTDLWD